MPTTPPLIAYHGNGWRALGEVIVEPFTAEGRVMTQKPPAGERAEYPGANAFRGLLDALQASARAAEVLSQPDPRRPGRTAYLIHGRTAEAVCDAVDTLTATVDPMRGGVPGYARFLGPVRDAVSGWRALGEVVVSP